MKCPKCGLHNPPSAMRCDCGFEFESVEGERQEDRVDVVCPTCGRRLRVPSLIGKKLQVKCPGGCPNFSFTVPLASDSVRKAGGNEEEVSKEKLSDRLWAPNAIHRLVLLLGTTAIVFMIVYPPYYIKSPNPSAIGGEKKFFYMYAPIYAPPRIYSDDPRFFPDEIALFSSVELDAQRLKFQIFAGFLAMAAAYLAVVLAQETVSKWRTTPHALDS